MKFIFPLHYRNQYKINSKSLFSQLSFSNMALGGMPVFQADRMQRDLDLSRLPPGTWSCNEGMQHRSRCRILDTERIEIKNWQRMSVEHFE